jgi:hypothetical protein
LFMRPEANLANRALHPRASSWRCWTLAPAAPRRGDMPFRQANERATRTAHMPIDTRRVRRSAFALRRRVTPTRTEQLAFVSCGRWHKAPPAPHARTRVRSPVRRQAGSDTSPAAGVGVRAFATPARIRVRHELTKRS